MSSGLSSLSSSDELDNFNPRTSSATPPKPLEEELASLALTLPHPHRLSDQEDVNGVSDGSEGDSTRFEIQRSDEETGVGVVCEANSASVVEGATGGSDGAAGVVWGRTNSEIEVDRPASPSSSGYAGERGSSSASSGRSEMDGVAEDEIQELRDDASVGENSKSVPSWVPGKRHGDEDDASISWRKRKKHFFILSHSGKPIYSRYGDEHKLAGFSASLQAIISFVEDGGDRVKWVRAGKHQVVFLVKGPIYLVCISCTEEPFESLRGQLELIYGQMILILTKSVNRCFERNPKFDMTSLLGGTDVVFSSLIHSFGWNPATFLHAYTCLPLAYGTRQAAGAILQDVADSGILFAILMCKHKVISLVGAQKASLHPDDMLLLANFVMSTESFRTSESFSPICLPRYNPMAFLYAYVHYFDVNTYLMLLTTNSDSFYHLKECRIRIETVLLKSNVLSEVQRSMLDGGMHVEDVPVDSLPRYRTISPHLGQQRAPSEFPERFKESYAGMGGPGGLWHFIYRSIYLDQYVSSEFSSPISSRQQQKRLYRAYQNIYASMHDKEIGPHKTQFRRDENYVLLCWVTQDFELYAAFDPLADKALAIKICNRVCQWIKDVDYEGAMQEKNELKKMLSSLERAKVDTRGESDCIEKFVGVDDGMNKACVEETLKPNEAQNLVFQSVPLEMEMLDGAEVSNKSIQSQEKSSEEQNDGLVGDELCPDINFDVKGGTQLDEEDKSVEEKDMSSLDDVKQMDVGTCMEIEPPAALIVEMLPEDLNTIRKKLERADEQLSESTRTVTVLSSLEKMIFEADKLSKQVEIVEDEVQSKQKEVESFKLALSEKQESRDLAQNKFCALRYSLTNFSSSIFYFEQRETRARERVDASKTYLDQRKKELAFLQARKDEIETRHIKIQKSEVELRSNLASLKSKIDEESQKQESDKVLFAIDNIEKTDPQPKNWQFAGRATDLLKSAEEKTKLQNEMKLAKEKLGVIRKELEDLMRKSRKVDSDIEAVQLEVQKASRSADEMEVAMQGVINEKKTLLEIQDAGITEFENIILDYQECMFEAGLKEAEIKILEEELQMEHRRMEELITAKSVAIQKMTQLLEDNRRSSCFLSEKMEEELKGIRSSVMEAKLLLGEGDLQHS